MRADRQQSPSPLHAPHPRLVNQGMEQEQVACAPLPLSQRSPNPLPFLLPDLEPHDPKQQKASHSLTDGSCTACVQGRCGPG